MNKSKNDNLEFDIDKFLNELNVESFIKKVVDTSINVPSNISFEDKVVYDSIYLSLLKRKEKEEIEFEIYEI